MSIRRLFFIWIYSRCFPTGLVGGLAGIFEAIFYWIYRCWWCFLLKPLSRDPYRLRSISNLQLDFFDTHHWDPSRARLRHISNLQLVVIAYGHRFQVSNKRMREADCNSIGQRLVPRPIVYHSSTDEDPEEEKRCPDDPDPPDRPTPLERLTEALEKDPKTIQELMVGRRVGWYKVHGEIGRGSFSRVKLALHALTKDKVAVKVLDKTRMDSHAQKTMYREIINMESLQHVNVVRLYEVVETPNRLYIMLEYAGGGDLQSNIADKGKLSDEESKIIFAQILSGIRHMHQHNIIHRDLKAENVLYTDSSCVKVADFGFSTCVANHNISLDTFCGSPPYAAPELFKDKTYLGPPVDIWAMGVLLFFMVTGTMPFKGETMGKLRRAVKTGFYTIPPGVSKPCSQLISLILKVTPAERCRLDQMLGCEWLLPVEAPVVVTPAVQPNPLRLVEEGVKLEEEEEECKAIMEKLGVTLEYIRNNPDSTNRSPVTGMYRILMHSAQVRRGCEALPAVRQVARDPRKDGLKAYKGLKQISTMCVMM